MSLFASAYSGTEESLFGVAATRSPQAGSMYVRLACPVMQIRSMTMIWTASLDIDVI
jgi:hypothetical protein